MQQVVVEHAGGRLDDRHVGLALQDQAHVHAAPGRAPQRLDDAVAGKEVRVGDDDALARAADGRQVVALDVGGVAAVVAADEHHLGGADGLDRGVGRVVEAAAEPARALAAKVSHGDRAQHEAVDVRHHRAGQLHRVVLLGLGAEVHHVVGRVVDAADEGALAVDDDDLAVHAAEHVQPLAEQAPAGVEHAHPHAGLGQRTEEAGRQVGRAEAVDHQVHLGAAARGLAQRGMQAQADLVLEQDEGLDDHLAPRLADGLEHAREEGLAVFQQLDAVAPVPAVHSSTSATSGAWSDRCDQGRRGSTTGACASALRT